MAETSDTSKTGSTSDAAETFEGRLRHLEEVADRLRDGSVRIDEATALFEEGMALAHALDSELQTIERRIELLVSDTGGQAAEDPPETTPFPEA